jgi:predicted DsbA family dithiol-disulfide isomerase
VRADRLQKEYEIQIRWVAFPLRTDTPEDGLSLKEIYAARNIDIDQAKKRFRQVADEIGLPLGERDKTYNSRPAQELAKWAEEKGKGDEFHKAVFRAYFVDARNIGKMDELLRIVTSIGLPEKEAKKTLESETFKKDVDADWSRCHALGITAVPTFVIDHQAVVGFQPYEALENLLMTKSVKKRSFS